MKCRELLIGGSIGLVLLAGCKSFDDYQEERVAYAVKHFERAQYDDIDRERFFHSMNASALP